MQNIHEIVRCFDPEMEQKGGPRERAVSLPNIFSIHFHGHPFF